MAEAARLANKTALITGVGAGIGKDCAMMFARHGARVIGCDIDSTAAAATADEAQAQGWAIEIAPPCDVTDEAAVAALIEYIAARYGLDILVNAAAAAIFKWIGDLSHADWRRTLAGELDSVFLVTSAAWPLLKASGAASIINFASANAWRALEGSPALAHCAGKGGVLAMTRQLAMEGAPHRIRANSISPGFIETAATAAHVAADPGFKAVVLGKAMIKRLGQPADIAGCATWLASDEASFVTGADIAVDGGASAW